MRRAAWSIVVALLCGAPWSNAARAEVKLLDQSAQLAVMGATAGDFAVTASWARRSGDAPIPAAARGLVLTLRHATITYPDCSEGDVTLTSDGARIPATVKIERGKVDCGGDGAEQVWLRVERAEVLAITRSKRLVIDLCGEPIALENRALSSLKKLLQKALAER